MADVILNDANLDPGEGEPMDFLLNEEGDLAFINGDLVLVRGDAAVSQEIRIRVRTFAREWFLDLSRGIEKERVFGKPANPVDAQAAYRAEIRKARRVRIVEDVSMSYDSQERRLSLSYVALTVSGTTIQDSFSFQG